MAHRKKKAGSSEAKAEEDVQSFASKLGPFVVAAEKTTMPMIFTNAKSAQNEVIFVNDSFLKLTNLERDDIILRPFADLLGKDNQLHSPSLPEIAKIGSKTLRCARKGEQDFNAAVFAWPVQDMNGSLHQYFASFHDLSDSETIAAELSLIQSQMIRLSRLSAMGTMAATLAHELNQPLAAISNYAAGCSNILEASDFQAEGLGDGLRAIADASDRAGNVIRRLREMTRNQAPHSERFSLGDTLVEAVQLLSAGACPGVDIRTRIDSPGCVKADRIEIEQVIINLIKNACEALDGTGSAGAITVSVSSEYGDVRLSVQDQGPGIPADIRDHLFQWTDSSKPDGMGIGLSISRTIIERHGGRIVLDRTSKAGSSFSFWLPESRA